MKNSTDKKSGLKISVILKIFYVGIVLGIICYILNEQAEEIVQQLKCMTVITLAELILCSVFFNVIEGISYYLMGKRCNNEFRLIHGIGCSYYCAFFKLSTLGSGTAAAGMVYLNRYKVQPSKSFGMITVNYIIQKLAIVIVCLIGFATHFEDMKEYYHKYFKFIALGVLVTIMFAIVLLLIILWGRLHTFIIYLTDKFIKRDDWKNKAEGFKQQLLSVRGESYELLKEKGFLIKILILNMVKFLGWYMLPCVVLGYNDTRSIFLGLSISALASALIGVIPSPGAAGSTEAMFYVLFSVITQSAKATTIMLIYRCFTYIFPFMAGAVMIMLKKLKLSRGLNSYFGKNN